MIYTFTWGESQPAAEKPGGEYNYVNDDVFDFLNVCNIVILSNVCLYQCAEDWLPLDSVAGVMTDPASNTGVHKFT